MCNTSLREGCLPCTQKTAIVTPVPKKQNADQDEPKNYRPINVPDIYLEEADLMPEFHSAYRKHQCTDYRVRTYKGFVRHSRRG